MTEDTKTHDALFLKRDFDREREETLRRQREEAERRRKAEQTAREFIYKQQDIDTAVNDAYERGKKDGYDAALQDQNQAILKLFHMLQDQLAVLESREEKRQHDAYVMTHHIALDAFRSLAPQLIAEDSAKRVSAFCQQMIEERGKHPRFTLTVASGMKTPVLEWLKAHGCALPTGVALDEDMELLPHQAQCDWGEGGCLHDLDHLRTQIETSLTRLLAGATATPMAQTTDDAEALANIDETLGDLCNDEAESEPQISNTSEIISPLEDQNHE